MDPVGTFREDYRMSYLAALITNIASQLYTKNPRMVNPSDLMPVWDIAVAMQEPPPQSAEEQKKKLFEIFGISNKKVRGQTNTKDKK